MSMPISRSWVRTTSFANATSKTLSGPRPFVGSAPRKKFRQIDMSGTIARSWYTVAMPRSRASRGEWKLTASPSTSSSPSSA